MQPRRTEPGADHEIVQGVSPTSGLLRRFDEAQRSLASALTDLIATGAASPTELIDAVGLEALERYLPSVLRVRMMRLALQEGRAGRPFDDDALLDAVSPSLLAAHLPPAVLRGALERLCPADAEADATTDDHELLDEGDEVTVAISGSETEALLASMPELTFASAHDLDD